MAVKRGDPAGIEITKRVGKISALVDPSALGSGHVAMGHSRWATHGAVTEANAHPHYGCDDRVAVIHNGIVENHRELKHRAGGARTPLPLADRHRSHRPPRRAVSARRAEDHGRGRAPRLPAPGGRNAVIVLARDSDEMVAVRNGSPLVLGAMVQDGAFACVLASDTPALLPHTRDIIFLGDGEMAHLNGSLRLYDATCGDAIERAPEHVTWEAAQAEKGEYPHYMIKEIMEQREALGRALNQPPETLQAVARAMRIAENVFFAGCGTAGKVAQMATYLFADIAGRPSSSILGSEFKNYRHSLHERTLLVAISQSGETADLLEAVEVAKARGSTVVAVVNVPGSTLTRLADHTLLVNAGPEKAVASTKATVGQIAIMTLLAYACAGLAADGVAVVTHAAASIDRTLGQESMGAIRALARRFKAAPRPLYHRARPELPGGAGGGRQDPGGQLYPCRGAGRRRTKALCHRPDRAGHAVHRVGAARRHAPRDPEQRHRGQGARRRHRGRLARAEPHLRRAYPRRRRGHGLGDRQP